MGTTSPLDWQTQTQYSWVELIEQARKNEVTADDLVITLEQYSDWSAIWDPHPILRSLWEQKITLTPAQRETISEIAKKGAITASKEAAKITHPEERVNGKSGYLQMVLYWWSILSWLDQIK